MIIEMTIVDWGFSFRLYLLVGCNLHEKMSRKSGLEGVTCNRGMWCFVKLVSVTRLCAH